MKYSKNLFAYQNGINIIPAGDIPQETDTNIIQPADTEEKTCPTCAAKSSAPVQYVYALGKTNPRFPDLTIEKEFAQVVSGDKTDGMSDNEVMSKVLSEEQNRYLARNLCWTFSIGGLETYLLTPMDPADLYMLINSINSTKMNSIDVIIGVLGPIAPQSYCNGLQLPIVGIEKMYSFDVNYFYNSIPNISKAEDQVFATISEELFMRIMQITDNAGATDEYRALNYLAVRYNGIYAVAADYYSRNFSLTGFEVRYAALNGTRRMVDVIVTFSNRATDVTEKQYCRVDVTGEFPFLVTKMQTYIDR